MKPSLKARLAAGEAVFGSFVFLPSPDIVEIMGLAGFDYVIIDLEHSPKSWDAVANMIRAAELHGVAPLVRVRENSEKEILEVLELGAEGVVVPFVRSADDMRRAAAAMHYPPLGSRGTCTLTRAARYGGLRSAFVEHTQRQNERLVMVAQIEDAAGVDNIGDILDCDPGADVVMIGRADLASALGCAGQVDDPRVVQATRQIIDAARNHARRSIRTGIGIYAPNDAAQWIDCGCRFFFYSADTLMMLNAATAAQQSFRTAITAHEATAAKRSE